MSTIGRAPFPEKGLPPSKAKHRKRLPLRFHAVSAPRRGARNRAGFSNRVVAQIA
jgi:hypothetical protein